MSAEFLSHVAGIQDQRYTSFEAQQAAAQQLNHALAQYHAHPYPEDPQMAYLHEESVLAAAHLVRGVHTLKKKVDKDTNDNERIYARIKERYEMADAHAELALQRDFANQEIDHMTRNYYRAAARLAMSNTIAWMTDVDGTLTICKPDYYEPLVPGSKVGDGLMNGDRGRFTGAHPRSWRLLQRHFPETFKSAGAMVPIRPGTDDLIRYLHEQGAEFTVLSAGMEPLIQGILSQLTEADKISEVLCVREDDVTSNYKVPSILHHALMRPDKAVIFCGDGSSDKPLAIQDVADHIAFYFALNGESFEQELTNHGYLHFSYDTQEDVMRHMMNIQELAKTRFAHLQCTENENTNLVMAA